MKDGITDLEKKIPSNEEHENFQTFEKIVNRETTKADAPLAIEIKNNINKCLRKKINSKNLEYLLWIVL